MSGRIAKIKEIFNTTLSNGAKVLGFGVDFQGTTHKAIATSIAGIDAKPILTDNAVTIKQENSGSQPLVIGTNDVLSESVTGEGEVQIYSRDAEGVKQADILLKSDGSIKLNNASGSFELKADGSCEASGDIIIGGISFLEHVHKLPVLQDGQGLPVAATPPDTLETKPPE
jgi:hypothetical protein